MIKLRDERKILHSTPGDPSHFVNLNIEGKHAAFKIILVFLKNTRK